MININPTKSEREGLKMHLIISENIGMIFETVYFFNQYKN